MANKRNIEKKNHNKDAHKKKPPQSNNNGIKRRHEFKN